VKYLTWFGASIFGAAIAAIYWTNHEAELAKTSPADVPVALAMPYRVPPMPAKSFGYSEVVEPILVLPEWEFAPAPELVAEVSGGSQSPMPLSVVASPRPEAGRESRPWMEYAPEDAELSATRRLEWARLSTQEPAFVSLEASFEESAEPPLLEAKKR